MTWTGDGWEVRSGRWQDSPPDGVDVVISDPPYDERTHQNRRSGANALGYGRDWQREPARLLGVSAEIKSFDPIDPSDVGPALVRIARRWVVPFCAVEQLGAYQESTDGEFVRGGVWIKDAPTPQFSGDRPGQWGDAIAIMHRGGAKRWNGGGRAAIWRGPHHRGERVHETQKPLWLMRRLVELFSDPGELVWDPYGGSMTTGVACIQLGRRFLGHELQDRYCEVGVERLRAAERGQTLREYRAGQEVLGL